MVMESWIFRVSCKVKASLTLQVTGSIHDSMNIPKIEFISEINNLPYLWVPYSDRYFNTDWQIEMF